MFFVFTDPATTEIYTLSLHDALPIFTFTVAEIVPGIGSLPPPNRLGNGIEKGGMDWDGSEAAEPGIRSEEHTSELQSHSDLVCRLLLEKKKKIRKLEMIDILKDTIDK